MLHETNNQNTRKRTLPPSVGGHAVHSLGTTVRGTLSRKQSHTTSATSSSAKHRQTSLDFPIIDSYSFSTTHMAEKSDKALQALQTATENYTISGVKVRFPYKAYPSQIAMMGKIIRAIKESENALLESPTGTGKTLTILSAVLAWREAEESRISIAKSELWKKSHLELLKRNASDSHQTSATRNVETSPFFTNGGTGGTQNSSASTNPDIDASEAKAIYNQARCDDDDDFMGGVVHSHRVKKVSAELKMSNVVEKLIADYEVGDTNDADAPILSVPTIYIASRTQKQIQQIVRELREKTSYRPRISILGSREHYCVHPHVKKSANKSEDCLALIDSDSCGYYHRARQLQGHPSIQGGSRDIIWDIEDMVTAGKKVRGCPYYASKALAETAQVIFAPYNYIIDPHVRATSNISLKDSILIIDEAHNIEGTCMESGSFDVTEQDMTETNADIEVIAKQGEHQNEYQTLSRMIRGFIDWRVRFKDKFTIQEFRRSIRIWSGSEINRALEEMEIFSTNIEMISQSYATIHSSTATNDKSNPHALQTLHKRSLQIIGAIVMILKWLFSSDADYINDYRMVLTKSEGDSRQKDGPTWIYTFSFWCLNPAVIFKEIESLTRSIILTSGTLSPIHSFSSELGAKFVHSLEAQHVILDDQICVGSLPSGANDMPLLGTYKSFETLDYQDQLGLCIVRLSKIIPEGMLIFLPSYSWLDKLVVRWQQTGLQGILGETKQIFIEPRANAKKEMESLMSNYDAACTQGTGAALFCVHRGKMSEGIDFADHRARGVICVGLPFPNIKDIRVLQKREYNTQRAGSRGLLTGSDWYSMQAYRALNQALGRCIRHRDDWGAIILLDERFSQSRCISNLSKWIRGRTRPWKNLREAETTLRSFFDHRAKVNADFKIHQEELMIEEQRKCEELKKQRLLEISQNMLGVPQDTQQHDPQSQDINNSAKVPCERADIANDQKSCLMTHSVSDSKDSCQASIYLESVISSTDIDIEQHQSDLRLIPQINVSSSKAVKSTIDLSKFSFDSRLVDKSRTGITGSDVKLPSAVKQKEVVVNDPISVCLPSGSDQSIAHIDSFVKPSQTSLRPTEQTAETHYDSNHLSVASIGSQLGCTRCGEEIVDTTYALEIAVTLHYVLQHAQGGAVFAVGDDAGMMIPYSAMRSDVLNAFWCQVDGLAYALGTCPNCNAVLGCDDSAREHSGHWFMFSNALSLQTPLSSSSAPSGQPRDLHTGNGQSDAGMTDNDTKPLASIPDNSQK
ncbi:hypothetical protein BASA62_005934 [Batrachochytrium salamandrivorans]|nr:hypothetical protein BASA62_005934 [Batrachochytrium salamandrivorans]